MYSHLFVYLWRRKLSILLISSSLILVTLWTWAVLDTSNGSFKNDELSIDDTREGHAHLLQRLISQANRVLRYQRAQALKTAPNGETKHTSAAIGGIIVPAAAHKTSAAGIVRFVVKHPSASGLVVDASAQSLTLVARHKKAPIVGESYLFEEERLKILENQQRSRNAVFEDINANNMDYDRMLSSAERQTQYEHELQRMGVPVIAGMGPDGPRAPHERLVHLDLKGAPPKLSFLKRLLPVLKSLGATGLLIEYEDMFPYSGVLQALAARNAYKPDELKDFLESAAMHGLSVMPLVQTFGHMEFALKLQGFDHMREIAENPQSICPSQKDSISFIEQMLGQVIEFHLQIGALNGSGADVPVKFTHVHIGCDEVFRMGECAQCRLHSHNEIFLTHTTSVANYVRGRWPQLRVVIWDDMLRAMTLSELQHSHIGSYVEPMIWVYINDIYHFIQPQLWDIYAKVFPTAWAASAFKGAFGETLMVPPLQRHLENNIRWLAVIAKEGGRFSKGFKGLALTGWQRYDHFAVLCELLPTGIPSLMTSLSTVSKGYFSTNPKDNELLHVLDCVFHPDSRRSGHPWIELQSNSHHNQLFSSCSYLGSLVYRFMLRLSDKLAEVQNYLMHVRDKSAWMSDYNVRNNFSSPLRVHSLTANTPALITELTAMAGEAYEVMNEVYDEYTIAEFVEQNILPTIVSLRGQLDNAQTLLQHRTWPQRPLLYSRVLVDYGLVPVELASSTQQHQPLHQ